MHAGRVVSGVAPTLLFLVTAKRFSYFEDLSIYIRPRTVLVFRSYGPFFCHAFRHRDALFTGSNFDAFDLILPRQRR